MEGAALNDFLVKDEVRHRDIMKKAGFMATEK
jgi:hypothetical protein